MIRVFKTGVHGHRTPLSYPFVAPVFDGRIELVRTPNDADVYVFAHVLDIQNAPYELVMDWRRRRRPVVWLSEEPFWDTIWGPDPLAKMIFPETRWGHLPVVQINHQTSDVFDFNCIPYYLLTNPRFEKTYRSLFSRNAARSVKEWSQWTSERTVELSFMFERRPERFHNVAWPKADLIGLCAWRTDLAEALNQPGFEKLGQSWQGGQNRFELTDWHGDKIAQMDGRARAMGALENTHHPLYISEKIFDAFACGSLPLYYASDLHRIHRFDLPKESWINLGGLSPNEAASQVRHRLVASDWSDALHAANVRLASVFCNDAIWLNERRRLGNSVCNALERVLEQFD